MSGVYGLSNSRGWIYIQAAENVQAALLDQLGKLRLDSGFGAVTGFTFELCEGGRRAARCSRLIEELKPAVKS